MIGLLYVDGLVLCSESVLAESEFKYFGCILDESGTNDVKCRRKVAVSVGYLVNTGSLQLKAAT